MYHFQTPNILPLNYCCYWRYYC